jgi:NAD(P)H-dependent FMN reductase
MMLALQIIVGSSRPGRAADEVLPWLLERVSSRPEFDCEVLDLRKWQLPMFSETPETVGDPAAPTYSSPTVRRWNDIIKRGDAYIVLTPEYNHSLPAIVKNAIDSVYQSHAFRNKPIGFVGYSAGVGAGIRAVEHLIQVAVTAELVPLRNTVQVAHVRAAFSQSGEPHEPATEASLLALLEDLEWWGRVLKQARADGELPPAARRRPRALASN